MSPKPKAIVLLSGGLDSTVSLAEILQTHDVLLTLTFNYGQRAFGKEVQASKMITQHYKLTHDIIALPWLSNLLPKAMTVAQGGKSSPVPEIWSEGGSENEAFFDAKPVWVPNRNGLFLNIAATYAEAFGADAIVFGANAEEGERFPDNTEEFREILNEVFTLSTLSHPKVICPVGKLHKPQIIERAKSLNVPLELIWSCYNNEPTQCGHCPSCFRLKSALQESPSGAFYSEKLVFSN